MQRRDAPEIRALEASIKEALANVFGHGTVRYNRYRAAGTLIQKIAQQIVPDWIAARGGGADGDDENIHEVHRELADGKARVLALSQTAVAGLEERIGDMQAPQPAVAHEMPKAGDLSKVFVVHGHDGEAREAIARFISEKLGGDRPNFQLADLGRAAPSIWPDVICDGHKGTRKDSRRPKSFLAAQGEPAQRGSNQRHASNRLIDTFKTI